MWEASREERGGLRNLAIIRSSLWSEYDDDFDGVCLKDKVCCTHYQSSYRFCQFLSFLLHFPPLFSVSIMSVVAKKTAVPITPVKTKKGSAPEEEVVAKTKFNIVSPEIKRERTKTAVKKTTESKVVEELLPKTLAVVEDESSVDERSSKVEAKATKKSSKVVAAKKSTEPVPEEDVEAVEEHKEENKFKSRVEILPQVKKVYQFVNQMTGALGGNGYNGAIYGELTVGSMQKVINIMVDKCEMNHRSRFIDVGAGLGKPNFHAAQSPGVRLSMGVELEHIRWQVSCPFILNFIVTHVIYFAFSYRCTIWIYS